MPCQRALPRLPAVSTSRHPLCGRARCQPSSRFCCCFAVIVVIFHGLSHNVDAREATTSIVVMPGRPHPQTRTTSLRGNAPSIVIIGRHHPPAPPCLTSVAASRPC